MRSALHSEPYTGTVWRMVEGQHLVSTMALVDSLQEQKLLEEILERSKPPVPIECQHLHYLMAAPFRYGLYPVNSRFRRRGQTPGVFYASEAAITAAAETVWSRLRFFAVAEGAELPKGAAEFTAFSVGVDVEAAIDLMAGPLSAEAVKWNNPDDYTACLELADTARKIGAGLIRYSSVRHPEGLANVAVLDCAAFAGAAPEERQTWKIVLRVGGAVVVREFPYAAWEMKVEGAKLEFV